MPNPSPSIQGRANDKFTLHLLARVFSPTSNGIDPTRQGIRRTPPSNKAGSQDAVSWPSLRRYFLHGESTTTGPSDPGEDEYFRIELDKWSPTIVPERGEPESFNSLAFQGFGVVRMSVPVSRCVRRRRRSTKRGSEAPIIERSRKTFEVRGPGSLASPKQKVR